MPFLSSLPSSSNRTPIYAPRTVSFAKRVRNGLMLALLAGMSMTYANLGGATGLRALSWSSLTAQTEAPSSVIQSATMTTKEVRQHALGPQNIVGDGEIHPFQVFSDPKAAPPSDLNFERSFLNELPEKADRESMERRHDENG
jgi:hypothetical protein